MDLRANFLALRRRDVSYKGSPKSVGSGNNDYDLPLPARLSNDLVSHFILPAWLHDKLNQPMSHP